MFRWFAIALTSSILTAGCGSITVSQKAERSSPGEAAPPVSEPLDNRPAVVAFGDSLTAGLGVDLAQAYPARLQARIDAAGLRYRVVNAGVSGDTSAQGLNRLSAVERLKPAVVIVEFGANDGLRGLPVSEIRRNLEEVIRKLVAGGAKVVLTGMEIPPNYGPAYTAQFRSMYRELGKFPGVSLVPFLLQGVGGVAELNQADGIHPTAEGHEILAENVWKVLEPLLKK